MKDERTEVQAVEGAVIDGVISQLPVVTRIRRVANLVEDLNPYTRRSRRAFLGLLAGVGTSVLAAACAPEQSVPVTRGGDQLQPLTQGVLEFLGLTRKTPTPTPESAAQVTRKTPTPAPKAAPTAVASDEVRGVPIEGFTPLNYIREQGQPIPRTPQELLDMAKKPGLLRGSLEASGYNVDFLRVGSETFVPWIEVSGVVSELTGLSEAEARIKYGSTIGMVYRTNEDRLGTFTAHMDSFLPTDELRGRFNSRTDMYGVFVEGRISLAGRLLGRLGLHGAPSLRFDFVREAVIRQICCNEVGKPPVKPRPTLPPPEVPPTEIPPTEGVLPPTATPEQLQEVCINGQFELKKEVEIRSIARSINYPGADTANIQDVKTAIARASCPTPTPLPTGTPPPTSVPAPTPERVVVEVTVNQEQKQEQQQSQQQLTPQQPTAQPSNTPVPPTNTLAPTSTETPIPPTPTNTPVFATPTSTPPPSTNTPTRVPTFTPVVATATETPRPFSTATVAPAQSTGTPTRVATLTPAASFDTPTPVSTAPSSPTPVGTRRVFPTPTAVAPAPSPTP